MSWKVAGGALAAVIALTGLTACDPAQPGTAALIDGDRLSSARLDRAVQEWKRQFPGDPAAVRLRQRASMRADFSSEPRTALRQLIEHRIWHHIAEDRGIQVTESQVDQEIASAGGRGALDSVVLASGLPTSQTRDRARVALIQREAVRQLTGFDASGALSPEQAQQARDRLDELYRSAAADLDIELHPRYGSFDARRGFGEVDYELSRPDPGTG